MFHPILLMARAEPAGQLGPTRRSFFKWNCFRLSPSSREAPEPKCRAYAGATVGGIYLRVAKRKRVLSGMRPTGRLHLVHFFGALQNWLKLQEEYDCFFFVADWHALTTHYEDTSSVAENTLQVAIDWLSVGLDPEKSTLFIQSQILEHAELHLLLSMITPLSWLERVPTYKEQIENLKERDLGTYGFLGYPLLQAADIVMYGEPRVELLVPVGEDQAPHVELTREIVRRFNTAFFEIQKQPSEKQMKELRDAFASKTDAASHKGLIEWEQLLRKIHRSPIELRQSVFANAKIKTADILTDPQRVKRTDPGRPEVCPVFAWHKLFSGQDLVARIDTECRTAAIGCVDCKK